MGSDPSGSCKYGRSGGNPDAGLSGSGNRGKNQHAIYPGWKLDLENEKRSFYTGDPETVQTDEPAVWTEKFFSRRTSVRAGA